MELDQETYNLIRDTAGDVKYIKKMMEKNQKDIEDHENRMRGVELFQAKLVGVALVASAGISAFIVWIQNIFGGSGS